MSKFTFRESAKVKNEIVMEQAKQIRKMYEESLKEIQDKINLLTAKQKAGNKAIQLKQLEKELVKSYSGISERIETAIKNNSTVVLNAIVNDAKNLAGKIGFTASAAYAKVPEKVIEKIVTGQIYQEGWTLSKALWKDEQLMRQDIQNIVAKGIAGNKSTLEIAKTLEQYVDPNAAKLWDWGKVYPGSKQKIDYNAQRLARTMVNHAYQQGTVEVIKENPFIEKVRWLSALAIGRTCELCESRHNQLFDKDKVPLDHPNGLCTIAPEVEDLDDIAKQAKAWKDAPDGTYPEIDTYAKSLGYKGKVEPVTVKIPVVTKTKEELEQEIFRLFKLSRAGKIDSKTFIFEKKRMLNEIDILEKLGTNTIKTEPTIIIPKVDESILKPSTPTKPILKTPEPKKEKIYKQIDFEELNDLALKPSINYPSDEKTKTMHKDIYGKYVKSGHSFQINSALRYGKAIPTEYVDVVKSLDTAIGSYKLDDDLLVRRFVDDGFMKATFKTTDVEELKNTIGSVFENKQFMSTTVSGNPYFKDRPAIMTIQCDKGTNCLPTTNIEEGEIVFGRNTRYEVVEIVDHSKNPLKLKNYENNEEFDYNFIEIVVHFIK